MHTYFCGVANNSDNLLGVPFKRCDDLFRVLIENSYVLVITTSGDSASIQVQT